MLRPPSVKRLMAVADALSLEKVDAPLALRLRAWWEGCSVANLAGDEGRPEGAGERENGAGDEPRPRRDPEPRKAAPQPEADDGRPWTEARIAAAEMLWGEGDINPGGTRRTMEMIGAFGVGREVNILNLAPGLGGAARQIAKEFDAWVTCYEADPVLAAEAAARSQKAGLSKKAAIHHRNLHEIEPRPNVFDCAFSREGLFTAERREDVFMAVQEGLKSRCPILLTDYFLAKGREGDPAVDKWLESEPVPVQPWTVDEAKEILAQTNFELRVAEDVSGTLREDIFEGWGQFIENSEKSGIPEHLLGAVLFMTELWTNRVAALDSGAVTLHRIVALKI